MNIITRTDESATTINLFFELFVNFLKIIYKHCHINVCKIKKTITSFRLVSETFILTKNLFHKKTETVLLHSFRFGFLFITVN